MVKVITQFKYNWINNNSTIFNQPLFYLGSVLKRHLLKIKELFHKNKKSIFENSVTNVAVHVRKQNIHDNHTLGLYDDKYFLDIMNHIRVTYPGEKIFHIFSQGDENNFQHFKNKDVLFHLNESIEKTFYSMVTSQILIMSKSSLSYTAAMLNDGIVYYLPFWHKPSSKWIIKK